MLVIRMVEAVRKALRHNYSGYVSISHSLGPSVKTVQVHGTYFSLSLELSTTSFRPTSPSQVERNVRYRELDQRVR